MMITAVFLLSFFGVIFFCNLLAFTPYIVETIHYKIKKRKERKV